MKIKFKIILIFLIIAVFPYYIFGEDLGPRVIGRVTFLEGVLERNKAGEIAWDFATEKTKLMESDKLRVGKRSYAAIELPGKCHIYLDRDTKIRIESRAEENKRVKLNNITIYYGNVFIRVGEFKDARFQHNIITPGAFVSTRNGAGFSLSVDNTAGTTYIMVLNGVISVKNILFRKSIFLNAEKKIYLDIGKEIEEPLSLDKRDLVELEWVNKIDPKMILSEIKKSDIKQQRIKTILSGTTHDKIIVCKLIDNSEYKGIWDIETGLSVMIADRLKQSIGDIIEIANSYGTSAYIASLKDKASIAITGKIVVFEFTKDVRKVASSDDILCYLSCRIEISLALISTQDNKTITNISASKVLVNKEKEGNLFKEITERPFSLNDKLFYQGVIGETILAVLQSVEERLKDYLQL